ncbi:hypothetical protein BJ165DRAFT_1409842 [Panaeolus papilionaceus]|nr:hypothetical protein BJ165DRAFT_1409842 [Panaeolus papilionaceus]
MGVKPLGYPKDNHPVGWEAILWGCIVLLVFQFMDFAKRTDLFGLVSAHCFLPLLSPTHSLKAMLEPCTAAASHLDIVRVRLSTWGPHKNKAKQQRWRGFLGFSAVGYDMRGIPRVGCWERETQFSSTPTFANENSAPPGPPPTSSTITCKALLSRYSIRSLFPFAYPALYPTSPVLQTPFMYILQRECTGHSGVGDGKDITSNVLESDEKVALRRAPSFLPEICRFLARGC